MIQPEDMLTVTQAADEMGVSPQAIYDAIAAGRITTTVFPGTSRTAVVLDEKLLDIGPTGRFDGGSAMLTMKVSGEMREAVRAEAKKRGVNSSEFVRWLIASHFEAKKEVPA